MIFKVLRVFVCFFIEEYVCVDYLSPQKEPEYSSSYRNFEDTSFYELSGISIPEILLNILYCYGFVQGKKSTLILTCRSKLVSYYLSKSLVVLDQDYQTLNNFS